jgi:5'-3' exonuclease
MFENSYRKILLENLETNVGLFENHNIIFCMDCPRHDIWRKSIYEAYKLNRDVKASEFNTKDVFNHAKTVVIPNLIEKLDCLIVEKDFAEGDDVIASLTSHISEKGDHVAIVSCDYDFAQLLNHPNTTIHNLQNMKIDLPKLVEKFNVESVDEYLKLKILMGDAGDNITAIHDRCGKVTALKYVKNPKTLLESKKDELHHIKLRLKRNQQLIDFRHIPTEIRNGIVDEFKTRLSQRRSI